MLNLPFCIPAPYEEENAESVVIEPELGRLSISEAQDSVLYLTISPLVVPTRSLPRLSISIQLMNPDTLEKV